tara:strand:+ start:455 stop:1084 length:630 start_codon:yes stop_codon:yes gene_type:complete
MQRQRTLPRTSRVLNITHFYSIKNRKSIYCESKLERDVMLTLEFDTNILAYTSQPLSINYELNDKEIRYTPDLLVQTVTGDFYFIEVKPHSIFQLEKNKQKFAFLRAHFRNRYQRELQLMRCHDIYIGAKIPNLDSLYRFKKFNVTQAAKVLFDELPSVIDSTIYRQLRRHENKHRFNDFMTLLAHDFFNFDITKNFESTQSLFKKRET